MASTILPHLENKIRDCIDGARSAGAALAKSAHEILDGAHAEAKPTAVGTAARADLLDREGVRALLTITHLSRVDGMLSALASVLRLLDDARDEERAAKRTEIEAEAVRDARTYRHAREHEGVTDKPEAWAPEAFRAWIDDEGGTEPLTIDEAEAVYIAAFMRALKGAS